MLPLGGGVGLGGGLGAFGVAGLVGIIGGRGQRDAPCADGDAADGHVRPVLAVGLGLEDRGVDADDEAVGAVLERGGDRRGAALAAAATAAASAAATLGGGVIGPEIGVNTPLFGSNTFYFNAEAGLGFRDDYGDLGVMPNVQVGLNIAL